MVISRVEKKKVMNISQQIWSISSDCQVNYGSPAGEAGSILDGQRYSVATKMFRRQFCGKHTLEMRNLFPLCICIAGDDISKV